MKSIAIIAAVALVAIAHDANEAFVRRSAIATRANSIQNEWVADADNWVARLPKDVVRGMLGAKKSNHTLPRKMFSAERRAAAPEAFDARTQWPNCDSIKDVRDQATCGSCWAFGAVEAMSDRYCIKHQVVKRLSTEDMNSCSGYCGGCDGGYPDCAWEYWMETGVVTDDCYPYSIPGCDHHIPGSENPCGETWDTPKCQKKCTQGTSTWAKDKTFASEVYSLYGEADFMAEIAESGPIEVALDVYEDFLTYKSGIYHHTTGTYEGGHAVKAIGWGVENGVKYWIIANSWNPHWGEQGFFRIRKGTDECGIESSGNAGLAE